MSCLGHLVDKSLCAEAVIDTYKWEAANLIFIYTYGLKKDFHCVKRLIYCGTSSIFKIHGFCESFNDLGAIHMFNWLFKKQPSSRVENEA